MSIDVRRSADRYRTEADGRTTRHSFSFGTHYDAANLGFAAITALNDETLPRGTGYTDHAHRDTEIVTWVLSGALRHTASDGTSELILPGDVQRISAGDGIVHAEVAHGEVSARFLQTWLRPDEPGGAPSYAHEAGVSGTGLTEVIGQHGLSLGTAGARLLVGQVGVGELHLPDAVSLHVFVVDGRLSVAADDLGAGDAVRISDQAPPPLKVIEPATLAVWAFSV